MKLYFSEETEVYDVHKGIISLKNIDSFTTYDMWGKHYDVQVKNVGNKPLKMTADKRFSFDADTMSQEGLYPIAPAKKWFLHLKQDEWDRRNLIAEHFELNEEFGACLVFENQAKEINKIKKLLRILPFYGLTVDRKKNAGTTIYILDKDKPVCFPTSLTAFSLEDIQERNISWTYGGWFKPLRRMDSKFYDELEKEGIFYEGALSIRGMSRELFIEEETVEKSTVELTVDDKAGIDLGTCYFCLPQNQY